MALAQQLIVSEMFYSIQGEGVSCGVPAVFLRLTKCNLRCLGFSYVDPQTSEHLGCDSAAVWRQGEKRDFAAAGFNGFHSTARPYITEALLY